MVNQASRSHGFTLIELLIATSLSLVVMITAATAFQLYNDLKKRRLSDIDEVFTQFHKLDLFVQALKGITPYMTKRGELAGFYFLGRQEGFTAVTHNPIFNPGYPAVIRVFREPDIAQGYRLVYEEASLRNVLLISADQELPFEDRVEIVSELTNLDFSYFGWESLAAKSNIESGKGPRLFTTYDGMNAVYQPDYITINLNNTAWRIGLPQRAVQYLGQLDPDT